LSSGEADGKTSCKVHIARYHIQGPPRLKLQICPIDTELKRLPIKDKQVVDKNNGEPDDHAHREHLN
jgi:hypothetical protein